MKKLLEATNTSRHHHFSSSSFGQELSDSCNLRLQLCERCELQQPAWRTGYGLPTTGERCDYLQHVVRLEIRKIHQSVPFHTRSRSISRRRSSGTWNIHQLLFDRIVHEPTCISWQHCHGPDPGDRRQIFVRLLSLRKPSDQRQEIYDQH